MSDRQRDVAATIASLRAGGPAIWLRSSVSRDLPDVIHPEEVAAATARFKRFEPALRAVFADAGWDGRIRSDMLDLPARAGAPPLLVKGDHALPLTGSIKARGGIHELLCRIETVAHTAGLLADGDYAALAGERARAVFARQTVTVASTGNLGFRVAGAARVFRPALRTESW